MRFYPKRFGDAEIAIGAVELEILYKGGRITGQFETHDGTRTVSIKLNKAVPPPAKTKSKARRKP